MPLPDSDNDGLLRRKFFAKNDLIANIIIDHQDSSYPAGDGRKLEKVVKGHRVTYDWSHSSVPGEPVHRYYRPTLNPHSALSRALAVREDHDARKIIDTLLQSAGEAVKTLNNSVAAGDIELKSKMDVMESNLGEWWMKSQLQSDIDEDYFFMRIQKQEGGSAGMGNPDGLSFVAELSNTLYSDGTQNDPDILLRYVDKNESENKKEWFSGIDVPKPINLSTIIRDWGR
ncbi:hypothetical protein V865_000280 [Kwoniella europaea PYCC6329]|uniref:Uncharacterized protein n=1 Tax=Kwoniella europaea PYCC6329 TaxID=1423913 RepID=A0AAX4K984_9TREE